MKKTSKFILVVGIVILILLASLIYQTFYKSQDTNEDDRIKVDNGMNLAKGNQEAKIIMIEFSDFQCPFCKSALPVIDKILNEYNVAFYYRNFPLSIHENSMIAAEAAECANEQGKFWQYHDILFANQDKLDKESLQKYAEQLNLNVSRFNLCFGSGKYKAKRKKIGIKEGMFYGLVPHIPCVLFIVLTLLGVTFAGVFLKNFLLNR